MTEPLTFEQYSRKRNLTHFDPCVAKEAWDARQPEVSALTAERDALKRELEVAQAVVKAGDELAKAVKYGENPFAGSDWEPVMAEALAAYLAAKSALEVKPLDRILKGRTAKIDPQDIGAPMLREDK